MILREAKGRCYHRKFFRYKRAYKSNMKDIRYPIVSGKFYPSQPKALTEMIETCFIQATKRLPVISSNPPSKPIGLVVPHAGYEFSGRVSAWAYDALAKDGLPDIVVIIGPNHTGLGSSIALMVEGSWKTPLGEVPIDKEFATLLNQDMIDTDRVAHQYEHSIEVQLPFLQYLYQKAKKNFSFVPLCMSVQDLRAATSVGKLIANAIRGTKKNVFVIASSDFSHVGFNYMSMPPRGIPVNKWAESQDNKAITGILALDERELIETVSKNNITMCGYGPVAAMLVALKNLGASEAKLITYSSSYEVMPGDSCVGYAAIILK